MNKVLFCVLLLSTFSLIAMNQEERWKVEDKKACEKIPHNVIIQAAIDMVEKPGTIPTHLRMTLLTLKELTNAETPPSLDTLVRLIMFRHINPSSINEDYTKEGVPFNYTQNYQRHISSAFPIPLAYNPHWQKTKNETLEQISSRISQRIVPVSSENSPEEEQIQELRTYRKIKSAHSSQPPTSPLGLYMDGDWRYDLDTKYPKVQTEFDTQHPEKALTPALIKFCRLVNKQPIVFNLRPICQEIQKAEQTSLSFAPSMKHLEQDDQVRLAYRLQQGLTHLNEFKTYLKTAPDGKSNLVALQKKLVPALIKVWQRNLEINPYKDEPLPNKPLCDCPVV